MSHEMDLLFLDRPEIIEVIFPVVYPPLFSYDYFQTYTSDGRTYSIEVERDTKINYGFWMGGKDIPSILYFHGNGETVSSHELVAPFYNQRGINLFVADYRGYGSSDEKPTVKICFDLNIDGNTPLFEVIDKLAYEDYTIAPNM